jgi:hypothetical protein
MIDYLHLFLPAMTLKHEGVTYAVTENKKILILCEAFAADKL